MTDLFFIPVALLGALLGLDVVSFPQAMLSRPLVAATLAGALVGDAGAGLLVGAMLELLALETLPFGASRYPEWGSAAVVGGALFASYGDARPGALGLAVLIGGTTAWVGGMSMVVLRRLNGQLARANLDRLAAGSARAVVGLQLAGLGGDFVRGFVLSAVALGIGRPAMRAALATWAASPRDSRVAVVALAAMVAGGAIWKLVHAVPRARWLFAGGLAAGLAALTFL